MSSIKVEHIGISPEEYNRRNYTTPGSLEDGRQRRAMEPLPALAPVSRPQKVDSTTNPRKANESAKAAAAKAHPVTEANQKDLKDRGITNA
jgi:hypothetical protein